MEPKNLSCSQKKKHFKLIATVKKKIPYGMNNFPNTSFLIWNKICDKNVNAGDFKWQNIILTHSFKVSEKKTPHKSSFVRSSLGHLKAPFNQSTASH